MKPTPENNESLRVKTLTWYKRISQVTAKHLAPLVPRPVVESMDKIDNTVDELIAHQIAALAYAEYMLSTMDAEHRTVIREQAAGLVKYLKSLPYPADPPI